MYSLFPFFPSVVLHFLHSSHLFMYVEFSLFSWSITLPFNVLEVSSFADSATAKQDFVCFKLNFASNQPNEHVNFTPHFLLFDSWYRDAAPKTNHSFQLRKPSNFACQFYVPRTIKQYFPIILFILFTEDVSFNHFFYSQFRFLLNLNTVDLFFSLPALYTCPTRFCVLLFFWNLYNPK